MKHLLKYFFLVTVTFFSVACSSDNDEVIDTNPVKIVYYKNADEFALTYDSKGTVSQSIRNQAFDLYKQGKWG